MLANRDRNSYQGMQPRLSKIWGLPYGNCPEYPRLQRGSRIAAGGRPALPAAHATFQTGCTSCQRRNLPTVSIGPRVASMDNGGGKAFCAGCKCMKRQEDAHRRSGGNAIRANLPYPKHSVELKQNARCGTDRREHVTDGEGGGSSARVETEATRCENDGVRREAPGRKWNPSKRCTRVNFDIHAVDGTAQRDAEQASNGEPSQ